MFWCWWLQRWRHCETLNIDLYIHVYIIVWIFQLWCKISETHALHYQMALNISYIRNFSLSFYLQNWLRYRHSNFCWCRLLCTTWPVNTLDLCAYASSQKSFSQLNEATVAPSGCFKMFLVPLGTFSNWFDSRETLPFFGLGEQLPISGCQVFPPE